MMMTVETFFIDIQTSKILIQMDMNKITDGL